MEDFRAKLQRLLKAAWGPSRSEFIQLIDESLREWEEWICNKQDEINRLQTVLPEIHDPDKKAETKAYIEEANQILRQQRVALEERKADREQLRRGSFGH